MPAWSSKGPLSTTSTMTNLLEVHDHRGSPLPSNRRLLSPVSRHNRLSRQDKLPDMLRRHSNSSRSSSSSSSDLLPINSEDEPHSASRRSSARTRTSNLAVRRPLTSLLLFFVAWKTLLLIVAVLSPGPSYDTSTKLLLAEYRNDSVRQLSPSPHPQEFSATFAFSALDRARNLDIVRADASLISSAIGLGPRLADLLDAGLDDVLARLAARLIKWDGIYFVSAGRRGRVYEQEWAFGWGYARLVQFLSEHITLFRDPLFNVAYVAILLSNFCHFLSVITLYDLAYTVSSVPTPQLRCRLAFITAALHIISPASFFLAAPYAEAMFSLFSFLGHVSFAKSTTDDETRLWKHEFFLILSGMTFGISTLARSNGVIAGLLPLASVILQLSRFPSIHVRKFVCTIIAGSLIGLGILYPQYLAYLEFCTGRQAHQGVEDLGWSKAPRLPTPEWCTRTLPSIYAHVQSRYWNVGFLRYWTPGNIGLFLIAAPMLGLLFASSFEALRGRLYSNPTPGNPIAWLTPPRPSVSSSQRGSRRLRRSPKPGLIRTVSASLQLGLKTIMDDSAPTSPFLPATFAIPQLILAFLALTTFHVQIITRLASGYPLWYLWLGGLVMNGVGSMDEDEEESSGREDDDSDEEEEEEADEVEEQGFTHPAGRASIRTSDHKESVFDIENDPFCVPVKKESVAPPFSIRMSRLIVRWMVIYGLVQGALFAAFLPPA